MRLRDYREHNNTFGDVQFALAIALDRLGFIAAARGVLLYEGLSYVGTRSAEEITKEHKRVADIVENVYIEKNGKRLKRNIVDSTIDYFWSNHVLPQKVSSSRTANATKLVTLSELCSQDRNAVYSETMSVIFHNSRNQLIVTYMHTKMFRMQFSPAVQRMLAIANKGKYNRLSKATISELLQSFIAFVNSNCANGSYKNDTANPDGYLIRTNGEGPLFWFMNDDSGEFFSILNKRGQFGSINGTDNYSLVDTVSVDTTRKEFEINFVNVCAMINTASRLLYCHKDNSNAVYDIFSHYRDKRQASTLAAFKKFNVIGCNIVSSDDLSISDDSSETTVMNKIGGRREISDLFEEEFEKGLRKDEIYNRLYVKCLQLTATQSVKDGIRLFDTSGHRPKMKALKNSDRFQILVNGYVALYDFIDFLNSDSNTRVGSINEVPVDIFRKADLLKRFKTFNDYIDYGEQIVKLYDDAITKPTSSPEVIESVMDNDTVFNLLSMRTVLRNNPVISALVSTNMSIFSKAVIMYNSTDEDKKTLDEFGNEMVNWTGFSFTDEEVCKLQFSDLESLCFNFAKRVCYNYARDVEYERQAYLDACEFCKVLYYTMMAEGNPVIDDYNRYLLTKDSDLEEMSLPDDFVESVGVKVAGELLTTRIQAIRLCYAIFTGDYPKTPGVFASLTLNWEQFRNLWCIYGVIDAYFTKFAKVASLFDSASSDESYLTYVKAASYENYLNLNQVMSSVSDLYVLYENNSLAKCNVDVEKNTSELIHSKKVAIQTAYNRLMKQQPKLCALTSKLIDASSNALCDFHTRSSFNSSLEEILRQASISIKSTVIVDQSTREIEQMLLSMYEVDNLGYVMINNSRFCSAGRYYVHSAGYTVDIGVEGFSGEAFKIVSEDLLRELSCIG